MGNHIASSMALGKALCDAIGLDAHSIVQRDRLETIPAVSHD
jgi:hypothetical protein